MSNKVKKTSNLFFSGVLILTIANLLVKPVAEKHHEPAKTQAPGRTAEAADETAEKDLDSTLEEGTR